MQFGTKGEREREYTDTTHTKYKVCLCSLHNGAMIQTDSTRISTRTMFNSKQGCDYYITNQMQIDCTIGLYNKLHNHVQQRLI